MGRIVGIAVFICLESEDGMCIGSMSCSERNLDGSLLSDVKLKRGWLIELVLERAEQRQG